MDQCLPDEMGAPGVGMRDLDSQAWFVSLYQEHADRVYAFMRYRVKEPAQAEDLTSAVFEKALKGMSAYDPAKGCVEVWLFSIARNVLRDMYRRRLRITFQSLEETGPIASADESMADTLIRRQSYALLRQSIARLDRRSQTLIALRYAAGLRNVQIAQVMQMTERHVSVALERARKKLKLWMKKEVWEDEA